MTHLAACRDLLALFVIGACCAAELAKCMHVHSAMNTTKVSGKVLKLSADSAVHFSQHDTLGSGAPNKCGNETNVANIHSELPDQFASLRCKWLAQM